MHRPDGPGPGFRHATRRIAALIAVSFVAGGLTAQAGATEPDAAALEAISPAIAPQFLGGTDGTEATASATKRRRGALKHRVFIRKADAVCHRQAPFFADLDRRLRKLYSQYLEAVAADNLPLAQFILDGYGQKVLKIPARLKKREKAIKRLLPVRGKPPRAWLKALRESIVAYAALGMRTSALAKDPTQENADELQATSDRAAKANKRYFKTAKAYGFRSCSKPLGDA